VKSGDTALDANHRGILGSCLLRQLTFGERMHAEAGWSSRTQRSCAELERLDAPEEGGERRLVEVPPALFAEALLDLRSIQRKELEEGLGGSRRP
jgi:hypothetical protein